MYLNSDRLFFSVENVEKFRKEENNIHNEVFKKAGSHNHAGCWDINEHLIEEV